MISKEFIAENKKTLALALPVCIGQLGHVSVGVVDTLMAGKLGALPLAAATFALGVLTPFMMFCLGFSFGITPLVSRAAGAGDHDGIAEVLRNGLYLNMFFACMCCSLLWFGTDALHYLHPPKQIMEQAIPFFRILAISFLPLQFFQVYKQFAEGLSETRRPMYISISANFINIILNYVLVFGLGKMEGLGLPGSAYATLISRTYMAFVMWAYVHFHPLFSRYKRKFEVKKISIPIIRTTLGISFPIALQLILETGAFGLAAVMAGWLGILEIGAHQIALSLASISYMAATGISAAATIRIGHEFGSGNFSAIRKVALSAYFLIVVLELGCTCVFIFLRSTLPGLYIEHEQIIAMATSLLMIAAFFQLSDGIQVVGLGILRGLGDVTIPTLYALISYWLIALPLGYIFAFSWSFGIQGVWYGLLAGLSVAAILLYWRFRMQLRKIMQTT